MGYPYRYLMGSRVYGDPRTTGRQETASMRKHRKRQVQRRAADPLRARALEIARERLATSGDDEGVRAIPTVEDWGQAKGEFRRMGIEGVRGYAAGRAIRELLPDGQCKAKTKLGKRCKNKASDTLCKRHSKKGTE